MVTRACSNRLGIAGGAAAAFGISHDRTLAEMMSLFGWRSFVPESVIFLLLIALVRTAVNTGGAPASHLPHPFWMPVLLMSSQYGVMGGLFTAVVASMLFFIGDLPAQSAALDFYGYAGIIAAQPCAWFGTALLLGGLRTLHLHHQAELQEQLTQTQLAAADMADGLETAAAEIGRLEHRIAVDLSTLTSFIRSLAALDLTDQPSLVAGIADLVRHGVGATSFAIYLHGPHGLKPVAGVEHGSRLPITAIRLFPPDLLCKIGFASLASGTATDVYGDPPLIWTPIHGTGAAEIIGAVVCTRLQPQQDRISAAYRLDDLGRVIAVLLSAYSKSACNAA